MSEKDMRDKGSNVTTRWRWTVKGTACARSTMPRDFEDSGEVVAESLGAAMVALCDGGPFWGLVDERSNGVTFIFEVIAEADQGGTP